MIPCNRSYVPLCSKPGARNRDGYAGRFAKQYLPFYTPGLYFFSGSTLSGAFARIPQDNRPFIGGTTMPDVFRKDCCS